MKDRLRPSGGISRERAADAYEVPVRIYEGEFEQAVVGLGGRV